MCEERTQSIGRRWQWWWWRGRSYCNGSYSENRNCKIFTENSSWTWEFSTCSTPKNERLIKKIVKRWSGTQRKTRPYCDQCECNYNRLDELTCHKRKDCGKKEPDFFCEECGKGFFQENGVREHYYQHTDIVLWFCTKCGEGFHFKWNKSKHKMACPNPNRPDKFQGRAPYNEEIEATFKLQATP